MRKYREECSASDWAIITMYVPTLSRSVKEAVYWDDRIVKLYMEDGSVNYFDLVGTWIFGVNKNRYERKEDKFKALFSNMLKMKLQSKFITQSEFAQKIGVTQGTLSNYLNKKSIPSADVLFRIAEVLEMPVDAFADFYYD